MVKRLLKHAAHVLFICFGRGFNDAINGFNDNGWSVLSGDGAEDVTVAINSTKNLGTTSNTLPMLGGILCAKASMLLQANNERIAYLLLNVYRPTFQMLSLLF